MLHFYFSFSGGTRAGDFPLPPTYHIKDYGILPAAYALMAAAAGRYFRNRAGTTSGRYTTDRIDIHAGAKLFRVLKNLLKPPKWSAIIYQTTMEKETENA